ncbi:pilin [Patescibacteria group bacterium]|nr:pilin [Patescibacteria group bacterium]
MPILKIGAKKIFLMKIMFIVFLSFLTSFSANAAIVFNSTTSYDTVNELTTGVVNWFLSITAGVTIFFLIIGGIYYLTAFGDEKRMQEGKKIITYAIYGLVLILISYSVVTTLNAIIFD